MTASEPLPAPMRNKSPPAPPTRTSSPARPLRSAPTWPAVMILSSALPVPAIEPGDMSTKFSMLSASTAVPQKCAYTVSTPPRAPSTARAVLSQRW
ncbi:MAG: hypothetical protein EOP58_01275 [Sphingomonadales bacterium]|nr:MAG: hypothetical protein EOP58_01275 [Sphingomonadales bacterium]